MTTPARARLNVLDLVLVGRDQTPAEAIANTVTTAQAAERAGYERYWMAEHHNMPGVASSSTAVLIGHVAEQTERIRVGAGGIMLPNHAPYIVAEQFGTLATIHGPRIDLGLGRAPGTDPVTSRALRRNEGAAMDFAAEVLELQGYLADAALGAAVRAYPGSGTNVPLWVLGSSHGGAQVAAELGLPFSFASHFAPAMLMSALQVYRSGFRASGREGAPTAPYTMAGANVMVADTQERAEQLFGAVLSRFHGIVTGRRAPVAPSEADLATVMADWTPAERQAVAAMVQVSFVGTPDAVRDQLGAFVEATGVDEVIVTCGAHDVADRVRSLELLAQAWRD